MTEIAHLIENTLSLMEKSKPFAEVIQNIKADSNFQNMVVVGICTENDALSVYEACEYVLYTYLRSKWEDICGDLQRPRKFIAYQDSKYIHTDSVKEILCKHLVQNCGVRMDGDAT